MEGKVEIIKKKIENLLTFFKSKNDYIYVFQKIRKMACSVSNLRKKIEIWKKKQYFVENRNYWPNRIEI